MTKGVSQDDRNGQSEADTDMVSRLLRAARTAHVGHEELSGFVDRNLGETGTARVRAHLRMCLICRERLVGQIELAVQERQPPPSGVDESSDLDCEPIREFLKHSEALVRTAAARAVPLLAPWAPLMVRDLRASLNDTDEGVRAAASAALEAMPFEMTNVAGIEHPELGRLGRAAGPKPGAAYFYESPDGLHGLAIREDEQGSLEVWFDSTDPGERDVDVVLFAEIDGRVINAGLKNWPRWMDRDRGSRFKTAIASKERDMFPRESVLRVATTRHPRSDGPHR